MPKGLILLAHGARDSRWREPFDALLQRVRTQRQDTEVRLAFLELMQPDIDGAAEALLACRCDELVVVPLFLGEGGHVRRDIPMLIERLRARYPGLRVRHSSAAGEDDKVLDALAAFCADALDTPG